MSKHYRVEQRERVVKMVLDHLDEYRSVYAACQAIGPKVGVGAESLRRWVLQAQVDANQRPGVPETELPQQGSNRGGRVHATEQGRHPATAHHVNVVDTVRAGTHPRDQRGQLRRRVRRTRFDLRLGDVNLLRQQLHQAGPLGQRHHRHQAGARHEIVVIEHR